MLETREIVQLRDKSFAKFFISFSGSNGSLMKIFLRSSTRKLGRRLLSSGGSCRKLFTVEK